MTEGTEDGIPADFDEVFEKLVEEVRAKFCDAIEPIQQSIEERFPEYAGGGASIIVLTGVSLACGQFIAAAGLPEATVAGMEDAIRNGRADGMERKLKRLQ